MTRTTKKALTSSAPIKGEVFPAAFSELFSKARYKVFYGGRGGAKSWAFAKALLLLGLQSKMRILCAREYQSSISDSVHKLLAEQIEAMGLTTAYQVQNTRIVARNGTEFIFKGLHHNILEIKSTEGVDICWVEEAQSVSEDSWQILIPTVRKKDSEIWISFNPLEKSDPTFQRFILNTPPRSIVRKVSWQDNPWFPRVLKDEMEYMRRVDPLGYAHVWEGEIRAISEALVFKGKYQVGAFEPPPETRFYFGADWGFASDPTAIIRCYIVGHSLYIDQEAYGVGVDIDDLARLPGERGRSMFDEVPGARVWPIYGDSARPETISYIRQRGFNIKPADKWKGCIEDGIAYLRSFESIIIHERCKHTLQEFSLYSYKTDPRTNDILPVIEDKNNHVIDALRYSLGAYIKRKGEMTISPAALRRGPRMR